MKREVMTDHEDMRYYEAKARQLRAESTIAGLAAARRWIANTWHTVSARTFAIGHKA